MKKWYGRNWLFGLLVICVYVCAGPPAFAANFRVNWAQELSTKSLWRFELINESVDTLNVQQLTVTFYGEGRRFWSEPVLLSPSYLRPGESGWVTLDTNTLPKVLPLRIDWEATWNPYDVPTLQKYWNKELVASVEIELNDFVQQSGPAFEAPHSYGPIESTPAPKQAPGRPQVDQQVSPVTGEM